MAAQLLPDEVAASVERFENCLAELSDSLEPVLRGLAPGRNAFSHVRASFPLAGSPPPPLQFVSDGGG